MTRRFANLPLRLPPKYADLRETFDTLLRYLDELTPATERLVVSIPGGNVLAALPNGVAQYGSRTAVVTSGKAPFTYSWRVDTYAAVPASPTIVPISPQTAETGFQSTGTNVNTQGLATVIVIDAEGRAGQASITINATHGSP